MLNIKFKIGSRVLQLRTDANLLQRELADKAGLHRTHLIKVETGKRNVSIENLQKIVGALDMSMADFFNDEMFGK